jgi:hypothetical protein
VESQEQWLYQQQQGQQRPRRGPPSTISGPAPSRCGQRCALLGSRRVHLSTSYLLHGRTTTPPVALPSRPYRRLHHTSSRLRLLPGHPRGTCGINSNWPTPSVSWPSLPRWSPTRSLTLAPPTTLSKWFYDTSLGTATRAARRGSLIARTKTLDAQARWIRWFM